ncbi:MAG: hypothetical protein D6679_13105 [Candidatus Hydrogenedentota bacterium]|nr:MAG: hypothetical protein D6679_13105 [Candidatus Hydrogenedentota bacterium]
MDRGEKKYCGAMLIVVLFLVACGKEPEESLRLDELKDGKIASLAPGMSLNKVLSEMGEPALQYAKPFSSEFVYYYPTKSILVEFTKDIEDLPVVTAVEAILSEDVLPERVRNSAAAAQAVYPKKRFPVRELPGESLGHGEYLVCNTLLLDVKTTPDGRFVKSIELSLYTPSPSVSRSTTTATTTIYPSGTSEASLEFSTVPAATVLRQSIPFGVISPDEKRIAFKVGNGHTPYVHVLEFEEPEMVLAIRFPDRESGFCWHPDGRFLAVGTKDNGLWIVNIEDRTGYQITNNGSDIAPAWSPDGRKIFFSLHGGDDLASVTVPGGLFQRLTFTPRFPTESGVTVDPTGRRICFQTRKSSAVLEDLAFLDISTGEIIPFKASRSAIEAHPAWSPDGRWIAYDLSRKGENSNNSDIYISSPDGKRTRRITRGPEQKFNPHWFSDSRRILFSRMQGGRAALRVIDIRTLRERPLFPAYENTGNALREIIY